MINMDKDLASLIVNHAFNDPMAGVTLEALKIQEFRNIITELKKLNKRLEHGSIQVRDEY